MFIVGLILDLLFFILGNLFIYLFASNVESLFYRNFLFGVVFLIPVVTIFSPLYILFFSLVMKLRSFPEL
jgi:hypothetical protein